jgi:predicted esterase
MSTAPSAPIAVRVALFGLSATVALSCQPPAPAAPRQVAVAVPAPTAVPTPIAAVAAVAEPVAQPVVAQEAPTRSPEPLVIDGQTRANLVEVLVGEREQRATIVAIHGLGDNPEAFVGWLRELSVPARIYAAQGIERYGADGRAWWQPSGGDEVAAARGITRAADAINAAVQSKTIGPQTCGASIVAFALAQRGGVPWSLAIPIAGRLPVGLLPTAATPRRAVQVRAFHGAADTVMAPRFGQQAVDALRARGFDATMQIFLGVRHEIPPAVVRAVLDEIARKIRSMGCG